MSLTNYGENAALTSLFSGTLYIALFTTLIDETGAGTEVSGGSYARTSTTFTVSGTAPTQAANAAVVSFPVATGSWGTVVAAAVYDAVSGGNMIGYVDPDDLSVHPLVSTGESVEFAIGAIVITLD